MAPPTVADIVLVRKQVLEKLIAMGIATRYQDLIGNNSSYASLQELTDKILMVDAAICLDIISTEGHPYLNKFMTLSTTEFSSGDKITEHLGIYGDVVVALTDADKVYKPSVPTKSREEILRMIDNETLYGGPSRHHFIEQNFIYHSGFQDSASAKVYYPVFTKTAACQSPQQYEDALIYGTVDIAEKFNSDDPFFARNRDAYLLCRQMIKGGAEFLPAAEQIDAMRKAA